MPSTAPSTKLPRSEPASTRSLACCAPAAIGLISRLKRLLSAGTSMTMPKAISSQAPAVRTTSPSSPIASPATPTSTPSMAKDSTMPRPIATGASRLA